MITHLKTLPGQITALRIYLLPLLWIFALFDLSIYLGLGLIIAVLSDVLDGFVARKLKQTNQMFGKFDSFADMLLTFSVLGWLVMLRWEIFVDHPYLSLTAFGLYLIRIIISLLKFKHLAYLHLFMAKLGGLVQAIFVIHSFLWGRYHQGLFFIAIGLFILAVLEEIIIIFIHPTLEGSIVSIFQVINDKYAMRSE